MLDMTLKFFGMVWQYTYNIMANINLGGISLWEWSIAFAIISIVLGAIGGLFYRKGH